MDKLYWFTNNEGDNITINCDSDIVASCIIQSVKSK